MEDLGKTGGGYVNYYEEAYFKNGFWIKEYRFAEEFANKLYQFILSKLNKKPTDTVFDDYQIIKPQTGWKKQIQTIVTETV